MTLLLGIAAYVFSGVGVGLYCASPLLQYAPSTPGEAFIKGIGSLVVWALGAAIWWVVVGALVR